MKDLSVVLLSVLVLAIAVPALAQTEHATNASSQASEPTMHRYLVKRSFPAGALAGLDQAAKDQVNAINAKLDVRWIRSYANADKTMTFCVYEGPSEQAVRDAAEANALPVDEIFEVPVDLMPTAAPPPEQ